MTTISPAIARIMNRHGGLLNPPLPPEMRSYAPLNAKATDELPIIHRQTPATERTVANGEAERWLMEHPIITVARYDPRDTVMTVSPDGVAVTKTIGTRALPLSAFAHEVGGALPRVRQDRRNGIAAAVGNDFLLESDEVPQHVLSSMAKGF